MTDISPEQLADLAAEGAPLLILDVREPFELAAFGAIPGAVNIPLGEIPDRLEELPRDSSSVIAVVCQSGSRSMDVARYLTRAGFTAVHNLVGGTAAWKEKGLPLAPYGGVSSPEGRARGSR